MSQTILFASVCVLFSARDARVVASRPRLFLVYVPILLGMTTACAMAAEFLSEAEVQQLARDRRFWGLALAVHGLQALRSWRRSRLPVLPDWRMLLPGPVLCLALIDISHSVLARVDGGSGFAVGLALGTIIGLVVGLVLLSRAVPTGRSGAIRCVLIAQVTALLVIPVLALPDKPVETQAIDWTVTGVVLGSVALLVGASFAWHQFRQRPRIEY